MFLSGMRYDAPGAFALPGGGTAAFNNMKWHKQLYEGLKDMGTQGFRTGKVTFTLPRIILTDFLEFWNNRINVHRSGMCNRIGNPISF